MNRREMLALCGGGLLAEPLVLPAAAAEAERAQYLKAMLSALCREPRPAGSRAFDTGAMLIRREMRGARLQVLVDSFRFTRWEPVGEAGFEAGGRRLETYVAENSPGTPQDGARGALRKGAGDYEIVDPSGLVAANVRISEFGRAIAALHSGNDTVPLFSVGRQDAAWMDQVVREGLPVRASARVRWTARVKTGNVAGTLPGDSEEEILFVAHADTKYNTPGANDNTASMICMLMLARALSGSRGRKTITFLATTGEEISFIGAEHYASLRKQAGTLGNIKVCVNLDSLSYGPNLQIYTTDAALARLALEIHRDLAIRSQPKVIGQDDVLDSAPFRAAGARTIYFNSRGDDARTLPLWHRPEDRAETVNPAFIESSFRVLLELAQRLRNGPDS